MPMESFLSFVKKLNKLPMRKMKKFTDLKMKCGENQEILRHSNQSAIAVPLILLTIHPNKLIFPPMKVPSMMLLRETVVPRNGFIF